MRTKQESIVGNTRAKNKRLTTGNIKSHSSKGSGVLIDLENYLKEYFPHNAKSIENHFISLSEASDQVNESLEAILELFSQISYQLQESEERFRLAFEAAKDGLFDWDIINDKAYFSAKFREMMGYPAEDYIDGINALTQVVHPDDLAPTLEAIEAHLQQRKPFFHQYRLRNITGEYRYFLVKGQAVWNEDGVPTRMAGSLTDLTEDLRLNRLITQMEKIGLIGAWEYNIITNEFYQTAIAQELLEYCSNQLNLETFISRFKSQECDDIVRESFQSAIKFGKAFDIEVAFITKKNTLRWLRIIADTIVEDGKLQQLVGVVMDLTGVKKQELSLIRSQRRWRSIFTNISDLVTVVDIDGKILFQSASVRTLLGFTEAELSGEKVFRFIPESEVDMIKEAFRKAQSHVGIGKRVELSIRTKYGTLIYLEAQANNQLNNPDLEAIIITCRDITERKQQELALVYKSKLLEAIAKASSMMVADIAVVDILQNVLVQVAPILDVDRAYFYESGYQNDSKRKVFRRVVEWLKEPEFIKNNSQRFNEFILDNYPDLLGVLNNDEVFVANAEDVIHEELRVYFEEMQIASLMVLPVFLKDQLCGFFGFDVHRNGRIWSNDEMAILKVLVSSVTNFLEGKLAKDALLLNNKRYEYIAQATEDVLWEYDVLNSRVKYWGVGFQNIFGYELESSIHPREERDRLIHHEDREKVIGAFNAFLSGVSDFWEGSYRYRKADGTYLYIIDKAMALRSNDGTIQNVIGTMRDITSLKERELQRSFLLEVNQIFKKNESVKETLGNIIGNMASLVGAQYAEAWELNITGEQLSFKAKWSLLNKSVFKKPYVITRLNQERGLIGECWKRKNVIWEPDIHKSKFIKKEEALGAALRSILCVPLIYKEDVVGVITLFFTDPSFFNNNYMSFFAGVGNHIGELLVQKQLEIRLNTFFDHSPALMCISSGVKFIKVNKSFYELLGYTEREMLERPFLEFIHPDDILSTLNATESVTENIQVHSFRNRYLTKSGKVIWLEWTSAFVDENDMIYSIAYDITKERELELQLEKERRDRVNEIAEAAILAQEHEKEELAKELHDNVNQILATSLMYLSLVKIDDAKQQENLSQAIGAVKASIKEIRQLSHALSSANLNGQDLHFALTNLFTVIKESKGIEVRYEIDLLLSGNFSHKLKLNIYRIIQEQFNNIYKHAHASMVVIELFDDSDWLVLRIKDNGVGMDPDKFESGIGLLNIRSRVDLFNGKMEVNTAIGQGFELIAYFIDRKASDQ